jgi:hypothetical protein
MCVLIIKKDENLLSLCTKSRIVILGNHKDRVWSTSDRFAPVLCQDSLCFLVSLAVEKGHPLRQGVCKNAFCQGTLLDDEITILHPPSGDPEADPQECWLLQQTWFHPVWYSILRYRTKNYFCGVHKQSTLNARLII